ncbi:MAG: TFIIB-type zinc ribbon-containing protein [Desulfurococcales archaeon]|nr:TFIIB-type zinc ribbon-containing protein [Desulfurococcales archaeon]
MRCPYCGSSDLIWDYQRGEVVCTQCASVIDRIYVSTIQRSDNDAEVKQKNLRVGEPVPKLKKATKDYLKILESIRDKSDVVIDVNAFWEYQKTGRRVKLLKKRLSPDLLNDCAVRVAMDILRKYPKLSARTDRAKIAIALLAISLVKGTRLNMASLTKKVGLSKVHIKRLEKLVLKERAFIDELKEAFSKVQ